MSGGLHHQILGQRRGTSEKEAETQAGGGPGVKDALPKVRTIKNKSSVYKETTGTHVSPTEINIYWIPDTH